jgi:hypothetical protein
VPSWPASPTLARLRAEQGRLRAAAATLRDAEGLLSGPLAVLLPAYEFALGDLLRERGDWRRPSAT